jgi:hypothetical protein
VMHTVACGWAVHRGGSRSEFDIYWSCSDEQIAWCAFAYDHNKLQLRAWRNSCLLQPASCPLQSQAEAVAGFGRLGMCRHVQTAPAKNPFWYSPK